MVGVLMFIMLIFGYGCLGWVEFVMFFDGVGV